MGTFDALDSDSWTASELKSALEATLTSSGQVEASSSTSTTSTTATDLNGMSISVTVADNEELDIVGIISTSTAVASSITLYIYEDSTEKKAFNIFESTTSTNGFTNTMAIQHTYAPGAGTYDIKLRWRNATAATTIYSIYRTLRVVTRRVA